MQNKNASKQNNFAGKKITWTFFLRCLNLTICIAYNIKITEWPILCS